MGTLHLGRITRIDLSDHVLAHLHAVLIAKFRVHEPVLLGWTSPDGRHDEVLVHPTQTVLATYDQDEEPRRLDRAWLERLMRAANGVAGLQLTPELVAELDAAGGAAADAATSEPAG
ncbi:hypothetical protein [Agromyces sp. GXS1127]|uniref:DUF7882 family protein n=1 Tax=Agromyces sp. GXS1127 TaxID=3424181 RepID=UPI003D31630F